MSLPNSAATAAAQQMHTADSILSNAFDLMGGGEGAFAAQQLINHMDAYAQQQRQLFQQQQQMNYHTSMPSPSHHNSLVSSSPLSVTPQSSPSPSSFLLSPATYNQHLVTTATSSAPLTATSNQHQFNQRHLQQQQQQQQQQHSNYTNLNRQQVTTTTSSPSTLHHRALSQISLISATTTATITTTTPPPPQLPPSINNNYTTDNHHTHHHQDQQQQQFTFNIQHHNINHHQMDAQQQQQQQQQQNVAITNGAQNQNGGCPMPQPSLANATAPAPPAATAASSPGPHTPPSSASSPSAVAATAAASATTPASAPVPHQHASPYKSCWCFGDSSYHMKILVPAVASGAIIGKGGETIASLQKDSGARVKMSKSHDFYPGTTERVCLITGTPEGIMTVVDFIMDKIREKPDLTTKIIDTESKQTQERDKQVKILVPNSTAGMIIGKGGAYIKQIKEESGSYVQISQKPKDISLQERCITIIGDKENNKNACKMILSKIVEDPQSGTCLNVSYADVNGPVANFNPTGSPYANNQNAINSSTASLNSTLGTSIGGSASAAGLLVNGTGINFSLNLSSPNPNPNLAVASQLLEHIKVAMRNSGYTDNATNEVCQALSVLVKYGVLGMGVGVPHANGAHTTLGSYLGVSALDQHTAAGAATAGNVFGAVGQVNLEQYTAAAAAAAAAAARPTQSQLEVGAHYDPFRHLGSAATQATTPVSLNNNSFGLTATTGTAAAGAGQTLGASATHSLGGISKSPTPGDLGAKDTKNVEIPEVIVGAILGPNGRSLVEIQHLSGANVQISKKGIFAPGTRNRIVTITGQPSAITKAQFLIEQKINEEETKRARQIPLTTVVN